MHMQYINWLEGDDEEDEERWKYDGKDEERWKYEERWKHDVKELCY